MTIISFYFPKQWKLLCFLKKPTRLLYFYMFSSLYFFSWSISNKVFSIIHLNTSIISLRIKSFVNSSVFSFFLFHFKKILYSFSIFFYRKLKFKGKGYYIYKAKRNCIAPQFGLSHRCYFFFPTLRYLKLAKFVFLLFTKNFYHLSWIPFSFFYIRPVNIFTQKGVRFFKQVTISKEGYISGFR